MKTKKTRAQLVGLVVRGSRETEDEGRRFQRGLGRLEEGR